MYTPEADGWGDAEGEAEAAVEAAVDAAELAGLGDAAAETLEAAGDEVREGAA